MMKEFQIAPTMNVVRGNVDNVEQQMRNLNNDSDEPPLDELVENSLLQRHSRSLCIAAVITFVVLESIIGLIQMNDSIALCKFDLSNDLSDYASMTLIATICGYLTIVITMKSTIQKMKDKNGVESILLCLKN